MKATFLCLLVAFCITGGLAAAAQPSVTEITASGTGSVSPSPDRARITAAVTTNAQSASDAVSQHNAIYDRIVAGLEKVGVARADIEVADPPAARSQSISMAVAEARANAQALALWD